MTTQRSGLIPNCFTLCGAAILFLGLLLATGCNTNWPTFKAYIAMVPPSSTTVEAGTSTFLMASSVPTGVTWSLSGNGCSGAACGSFTNATATSVDYVAPDTITGSSLNVTITAASTSASSVTSSVTLTVLPVSVSIAPPASDIVAPGNSVQLTASVTNDLSGDGVTWSLNGVSGCSGASCGTLSSATPSSVVYTAPPGAAGIGVSVVATSAADPAISASQSLTVPELSSAITFSPTNLPPAIAGQPYTATIAFSGGTAPYTATVSDQPSWVTVTNTGDSITLAGTPPAGTTGSDAIQIIATDSSLPVAFTNIAQMTLTTYPTAGVDNGLLSGTYAFYGTGWLDGTSAATTQPVAYIGSFTTDGNGTITGGEMDMNGGTGMISYSSLAGTYNIDANQVGTMNFLPAGAPAPITFAIGLGGVNNGVSSSGSFTEYDDTTGVSIALSGGSSGMRITGSIALQSSSVLSTSSSPLTGSYAFGMQGRNAVQDITSTCSAVTASCGPVSLAGAMTMGSDGAITSGMEDITEGETTEAQVPLSGVLDNAGNTDAFGRATGSITASGSSLLDWPSSFILYMVNPQTFYVMSADAYAGSTLVSGQAMQQNLTDIASTPFSSTQPVVAYGNIASTQNYPTANGNTRVELMLLTMAPTSATAGSMRGYWFVNASGSFTNNGKIATSSYTYTVSPNGRVATSNANVPDMYLTDTNTGFATSYNSSAGLFQVQPQTSTTLNAGTYVLSTPIPNSQLTPGESGTVTIPNGGLAATASGVAVTGEAYASYGSNTSKLNTEQMENPTLPTSPAPSLLVNEQLTGAMSNTNGLLPNASFTLTPGILACTATPSATKGTLGGGYIISPTEFACVSGVAGYDTLVLFQQ